MYNVYILCNTCLFIDKCVSVKTERLIIFNCTFLSSNHYDILFSFNVHVNIAPFSCGYQHSILLLPHYYLFTLCFLYMCNFLNEFNKA